MAFRVGQQVVCLGRATSYERAFGDGAWPPEIKKGGIYTVRDVDTRAAEYGWPVVLRFEEYFAEVVSDGLVAETWELGFPGDCFRPVIERPADTGFAILEKIRRAVSRELVT